MAGVLLHSGELRDYSALGDEGQPVYSVATQLREVIRARVGLAAANCLAIPKINENRSTVDWYASQTGTVVPWAAATPMEQAVALETLDRYKEEVTASLSSISGVSGREHQIIQSLKDKVFTHPSNSCVFLVDGQPVLTFWGFYEGQAPMADPFFNLRPPPVVASAAPASAGVPLGAAAGIGGAAAVTVATRRPWWHWLLLALLLLALLFFVLRACSPSGSVTLPGLSAPTTSPSIDRSQLPQPDLNVREPRELQNRSTDSAIELKALSSDGVVRTVEPGGLGVALGDPSERGLGDSSVGLPDPSALGAADADSLADSAEPAQTTADELGLAQAEVSEPMVDHTLMPEAPPQIDTQDPGQMAPPEIAAVTEGLTDQVPGADATMNPVPVPVPVPNATAPLGQPMQIPTEAAQSGSVSFLDGRWRAAGGIQDAKTGQPVRLWYDFKDGRGTVTVEKADGVRCQTNASSQMDAGKLLITGQGGVAQCSDGTSMALPTISCTPDQSGQANCTGVASDGKPLPIMIRQSP